MELSGTDPLLEQLGAEAEVVVGEGLGELDLHACMALRPASHHYLVVRHELHAHGRMFPIDIIIIPSSFQLFFCDAMTAA